MTVLTTITAYKTEKLNRKQYNIKFMRRQMTITNNKQLDIQAEGDVNISTNRMRWIEGFHSGKTREMLEADARYYVHQSLSTPCLNVLESCEGSWITDAEGRRFLDFHGNCVHQAGYANPRVIQAVKDQLDQMCFCPRRYTNEPAIRLAKKLADIAPGNLNRVLFAPGGTLVNGMAVKLARAATGRHKVVSMWDSFHGASLDMISIGGEALFRQNIGPLMTGTEHVPPPYCYRCVWDCEPDNCTLKCADYIEYVMEKERDIACVIGETIRSTSIIMPKGYWKRVREICDKYGALLILDEIPNWLGRTGKMFTCMNYDVVPDIITVGKGLGGGIFPFAAMICREDLNILPDRSLGHYTHEKNPVACAAAYETIAVIEEENLIENARVMGRYMLEQLNGLYDKYEMVGAVRGIGLMAGIEVVRDRKTKARAVEETDRLMYYALDKGLNFKTTMRNIITLTPPLSVTKDEIDFAVNALGECFAEIQAPAIK